MLNRRYQLAIMLCLTVMIAACATTGQQAMTQKQQVVVWMDMYNAQFHDVQIVLSNPAAPAAQRAMVLKKKDVLIQLWPLIVTSVDIVAKGGTPSEQNVTAITSLINQLTSMALR